MVGLLSSSLILFIIASIAFFFTTPSIGDGLTAGRGNWTFGGSVAETFDDYVSKSVPLYLEGHDLIFGIVISLLS